MNWSPELIFGATCIIFRTGAVPKAPGARRGPRGAENRPNARGRTYNLILPQVCPTARKLSALPRPTGPPRAPGSSRLCVEIQTGLPCKLVPCVAQYCFRAVSRPSGPNLSQTAIGKHRNQLSGRPSAGRRADFEAFPVAISPDLRPGSTIA